MGLLARQVHAHDAASGITQGLEVAQGLGRLESGETVACTRNGHVVLVLTRELDEDAVGASSLVQLPGGMQVARTEAHGRGQLQPVPQ